MYMCMDIFNNVFSSESTALYITLTKYKNCCLCSSLEAIHIRDPLLSKLVTITNFGQHTPVTYCVLMIIVCLHLPDFVHMMLKISTIGTIVCQFQTYRI